jgi:medium-chain acyl-[acyl-carrier-protein] hydrolase
METWLLPRRGRAPGEVCLVCLPYAGGGAAVFHGWQRELPERVEVRPAILPGRDRRMREPAAREIGAATRALADGLAPHLDGPFALFGHSMGAMLGYELAREQVRRGARAPEHLFVSGFRAPHLPDRNPPLHRLSDDEFVRAIDRLDGTPRDVLEHEGLMQLVLPTLRADMELVETYAWEAAAPLACPITVFGAPDDPIVSREELDGWCEHTTGGCRTAFFERGGHFYLHELRAELLAEVAADLGLSC